MEARAIDIPFPPLPREGKDQKKYLPSPAMGEGGNAAAFPGGGDSIGLPLEGALSSTVMSENETSPALLDLTLHPNRSLSPTGFWIIMGALATVSFIGGIVLWTIGAWPVIGFVGLDVALVYWAFKASFAAGRVYERVRLTGDALTVERIDTRGHRRIESLPAYWLRVEVETPPGRHAALRLTSRGRSLTIGAFLSPDERGEVADVLREAVYRLRHGPSLAID